MSTEEPQRTGSTAVNDEDADATMTTPTAPAAMAAGNRKRPRLDLSVAASEKEAAGRERKRGKKSMFGVLLGTLNQAKSEDKERSRSEAAKKRQLTEQRLQDRLRKETDSVRRAEEVKKDKTIANRKEEDLQLKDSIHKLRRTRLPLLANFLTTTDRIPPTSSSMPSSPLASLPKSHPPPLYYLPAILTPDQEAFLEKRKSEVAEAAEAEWSTFHAERATGVAEILKLRERVAEEEAKKRTRSGSTSVAVENGDDVRMGDDHEELSGNKEMDGGGVKKEEAGMDVDDETKPPPPPETCAPVPEDAESKPAKTETKVTSVKRETVQADEDDAVEY
ncbi:hypothetical protein EIP91_004880 [Steccherinum ochraceum]|uniref:Pinin/SDK/MemA protein domain-containing protein n=1 Tax=Steccherinum ochraceum TaxID=92696 RepID=A0A4R0RAN7_9APHY|nr:hypothetical protein EIP91_004880 [Steccherinum ochraceum]